MAGTRERIRAPGLAPLTAELSGLLARYGIPGASIGVLARDTAHHLGLGNRTAEHGGQIEPTTLFRAASVSKVFTASLLMRLVERQDLDPDCPVRTYLPDFAVADKKTTQTVTLRQLATHRGGWTPNLNEGRPPDELDDGTLARAVEDMARAEQISPPGQFYSYSNSGFSVLGRVIEVITGTTFENAAQRLLLRPASLEHTYFPTTATLPGGLAMGHTGVPPTVVRPWTRSRARSPAGGLVSTAPDLITFARGLLDGNPVLRPDTVRTMWSPAAGAVGFAERIGMGWNINRLSDGTPYVWHGGNTGGYTALFSIVPSRRFAVAVLVNSTAYAPAVDLLQDRVTEHFLGRRRRQFPPRPAVAVSPDPDLPGTYTDGIDEISVVPTADGVRLTPTTPGLPLPPADVRFTAKDTGTTAVGGADLVVRFLRDDTGQVRWLRITGLVFRRKAVG